MAANLSTNFARRFRVLSISSTNMRSTATVLRRSSWNAMGMLWRCSTLAAKARVAWHLEPSLPSMFTCRPMTKPPTSYSSTSENSLSKSSDSFRRRIVFKGDAIRHVVSERAKPIDLLPRSSLNNLFCDAMAARSASGLIVGMSNDSFRALLIRQCSKRKQGRICR